MNTGALLIERGTSLLWVGHTLERMGDRITNICDREMNPKGVRT